MTLPDLLKAHQDAIARLGSIQKQTSDPTTIQAAKDAVTKAGQAYMDAAQEEAKKKKPSTSPAATLLGGAR